MDTSEDRKAKLYSAADYYAKKVNANVEAAVRRKINELQRAECEESE